MEMLISMERAVISAAIVITVFRDNDRSILRDIDTALRAAHARGVAHRDLTPVNVKVRPDGHERARRRDRQRKGQGRVATGPADRLDDAFVETIGAYTCNSIVSASDPKATLDIWETRGPAWTTRAERPRQERPGPRDTRDAIAAMT